MAMLVQCPNPACRASCSVAEPAGDRPVRCPKCLKPFVVKPTFDGQKGDTKKSQPSSNANPFPVLPVVFGRYWILRPLGRGGMGAVYLAQDSQLGRQVALKVPFFDAAESPQRAERFVREARSAAFLQHPNICTVFDAGQIDGRPFITMAYIAGAPLEDEIDPEAPMPQARAAEIVRKIALALEHAHRAGIVHRDLKPANVMLAADGEPVVMDFGLAKRVVDVDPNEAKLTRDGGLLGTVSYMAPEQVKGENSAIGPATDVYALGVMLFEMLTGRTPFAGGMTAVIGQILAAPSPPVREFRPEADARLEAVCRKAMAKSPADRFASMAEFADALGTYLKAPSLPSPPRPAHPSPSLWQAATIPPPPRPTPPAAAVSKVAPPAAGRFRSDRVRAAPSATCASRKANWGRAVAAAYRRHQWPILAGAAAYLLLAVLVALWASGVFDAKTPVLANANPPPDTGKTTPPTPSASLVDQDKTTPPPPGMGKTLPPLPQKDKALPADKDNSPAPPPQPDKDKTTLAGAPAEITNTIDMKLRLIKAGAFKMGSPDSDKEAPDDEKPQHNVEIMRPFYLGVYPVTKGQFAAFAKDDGYKTEAETTALDRHTWRNPPGGSFPFFLSTYAQTDDDPVVYVTWNDAAKFCQWLSKKEGKTYELPTEAEWEYACRAGTTTSYFFGNDPKDLSDYAWYLGNSGNHTHPAGKKKPNPWGLYDMGGNVWQWCADWHGPYDKNDVKDPKSEESADGHVGRGGSWSSVPGFCRSANRGGYGPSLLPVSDGFRVVLRLPAGTP